MESVSSILYTLYRDTPGHGSWIVACLDGAWQRLLGETLSGICRPHSFDRSELCVEILDPAWEQALHAVKKDLEEKLRTATGGEVRRVRLALPDDLNNRPASATEELRADPSNRTVR